MDDDMFEVTVIGYGVTGAATAYELSKYVKGDILVVEKNFKIGGENQSSKNMLVIHAGVYYDPAIMPLKARLCVAGNAEMYKFCRAYHVKHRQTGKLIVATNAREIEYLEDTLKIARKNGVPGIEMISGALAQKLDPNVRAVAALYVPTTGIVDPLSLIERLQGLAEHQGENIYFEPGTTVVGITPQDGYFEVATKNRGVFKTKKIVNAAGLYSDDIARMVNPNSPYDIWPVKGEAAKVYKRDLDVSMSLYPAPHGFWKDTGEKVDVPLAEFKKLRAAGKIITTVGVHITPTFDNFVAIGPAQVRVTDKEDYVPTYTEQYYFDRVKGFSPGLRLEDISLYQTGIQANVMKNGVLHPDFVIERDPVHPNCYHAIGISSPGLSACIPIASELVTMMGYKNKSSILL